MKKVILYIIALDKEKTFHLTTNDNDGEIELSNFNKDELEKLVMGEFKKSEYKPGKPNRQLTIYEKEKLRAQARNLNLNSENVSKIVNLLGFYRK